MPKRVRLWICMVAALLLLIVAVPQLPVFGSPLAFGFSILWLAFCVLVIAANSHALLRLGRGEALERPQLTKEERQALANVRRYARRRQPSR